MEGDTELKKLADDLRGTWEEFKQEHAASQEEIKKLGEVTAETEQKMTRLDERLAEIDVKLQKAALRENDDDDGGDGAARKAFVEYLRKGAPDLDAETKAQLQVGDDTAGGYLAPAEYVREIIKGVIEFCPFRPLARIYSTQAGSIKVPKRTGTFAASWTASGGTRSETTGYTFGLEEIPTHELYARADVENQLLEDAVFALDGELNQEFAEQFGKAESTAFISGSGVGQPQGILNGGITSVPTASNDTFAAVDLINLFYDVKTDYARNGTFLFNRGIMKAVRKFQDSQGNYLWQPGLAGLAPATILERPYVETPELAAAVADAAKIALFGDFRRGYTIVDRVSMAVARDPFTQAYSGATVFHARRRVGGQVVNSEAIRVLTVA